MEFPNNYSYLNANKSFNIFTVNLTLKISMKISTKKVTIEKRIAQLQKELKSIESSVAFKKENTIKRALASLMIKHGCSKNDLIALLQESNLASVRQRKNAVSTSRKPRKLKIFRNPKTGETVETRGGNHKVLKAWKAKYNLKNIDDWLVETKD